MKIERTPQERNQSALENRNSACLEEKARPKLFPHLRGRGLGRDSHVGTGQRAFRQAFSFRVVTCIAFMSLTVAWVTGTEGSGSVYPLGAETVMTGLTPAAGQTMFAEFNIKYTANSLLNGQGRSAVPGFKLSVSGFAPKITHNWGVPVLGGTLVSWAAVPVLYEWVRTPSGANATMGFSNAVVGTDIAYNRGNWHWWYGFDVALPAPVYHKGGPINIGQHNFATAPSGAFTYLPHHGRTEISSRLQYYNNYTDHATQYHSGNEFLWEYVAMQNVTKKLALGANGYFYQQTTGDRLLGVICAGGNQGRNMAIGPEVRYELGHAALIGKFYRDTLVENHPKGNEFWFELAVPLSHPHPKQQTQRLSQLN